MADLPFPIRERYSIFVDEYVKDYDPAAAYVRTYGIGNEKYDTVLARGRKILESKWIQQEIERKSAGRLKLADITPGRIAMELARIAFHDPRKLFKRTEIRNPATGEMHVLEELLPISEIDDDTVAALKEIRPATGITPAQIKTADKTVALASLAKMLGLINDLIPAKPNLDKAHRSDSEALSESEIVALLAESVDDDDDTIEMTDATT